MRDHSMNGRRARMAKVLLRPCAPEHLWKWKSRPAAGFTMESLVNRILATGWLLYASQRTAA